ncbi:MAG: heme-binding protein [Pseudomonadota bacterium]
MSVPVTQIPVITYDTAAQLIADALTHARANDWRVSAVVVDPSGIVVASARMDGVSPIILEIATDKAFTATLGRTTRAYYEHMSSSQDLTLGLQTRQRLCAWEGGAPIRQGDALIGAFGVSGATGPEDAECAEVALEKAGLSAA